MPKAAFDRRKARVNASDNYLTPLEIAKLLDTDPELPFAIAPLLNVGESPASYRRETWSADTHYYTTANGAGRLIVAFAAPGGRVGVPVSAFLQMLKADAYDVIVLRDSRDLHYTHGVEGLGTFLETMRRIEDFAAAKGFQQIITFGSSLGGYPALRGGRLLKASRAISVGGRYPWHPGRIMRKEASVEAFDLLCACTHSSPTELVVVYPSRHEVDKSAIDVLQRTFPECTAIPIDTDKHNVIGYFYKAHLLPLFLACLFDYWDEARIRADLLARLEQSARQRLAWLWQRDEPAKTKSNGRYARMLERVRGTPLWRVTWPARGLRGVLRGWRDSPSRRRIV